LGLAAWVKTTGGKGLHIVVPIKPALDWSACLSFSRDVSEAMARTDPLYTTRFTKRGRERKILIDYLRNNRTNTSICAYSPRARLGAQVSMPLAWRELASAPARWTLLTVPRRLHRQRADPWDGYWTTSQRISKESAGALRQL
jgi:bifunctional non-homologous end joining protein LigD